MDNIDTSDISDYSGGCESALTHCLLNAVLIVIVLWALRQLARKTRHKYAIAAKIDSWCSCAENYVVVDMVSEHSRGSDTGK